MVSGRSMDSMPIGNDTRGINSNSAEDTDYEDIADNSAADVVLLTGRPMAKVTRLKNLIIQHHCLKVSIPII